MNTARYWTGTLFWRMKCDNTRLFRWMLDHDLAR